MGNIMFLRETLYEFVIYTKHEEEKARKKRKYLRKLILKTQYLCFIPLRLNAILTRMSEGSKIRPSTPKAARIMNGTYSSSGTRAGSGFIVIPSGA
jgi:hypothetical protein